MSSSPDREAVLARARELLMARQAEDCARHLHGWLQQAPDDPEALRLCGLAEYAAGRLPQAEDCFRQVITRFPDWPLPYDNLCLVLVGQQRLPEAEQSARRALELRPQFAEAANNLGVTLQLQGRLDEAREAFRRALAIRPEHRDANTNLQRIERRLREQQAQGPTPVSLPDNLLTAVQVNPQGPSTVAPPPPGVTPDMAWQWHCQSLELMNAGRDAEALPLILQVLQVVPHVPAVHNNLGVTLERLDRYLDALSAYDQCLVLDPAYAEAHSNRGNVLRKLCRLDDAVAAYRRALELKPDFLDAGNNLGAVLHDRCQYVEAEAQYRRVLALQPKFARALSNLGLSLAMQGRLTEAIAAHEQAVEWEPQSSEFWCELGNALKSSGQLERALQAFRKAIDLQPQNLTASVCWLLALQYRPGITLAQLRHEHEEFDARLTRKFREHWRPPTNVRDPDRRLKIGFVSADLRKHPVGNFLAGWLPCVDREQFELYCYYNHPLSDRDTLRLKGCVPGWRDVKGLTDGQLDRLIRTDGIDVLFDLSGHTAGQRLAVFARKPAPLQITWMGYVGTTGLLAMDYLLSDHFETPSGVEPGYTERLLRLPNDYICFTPPVDAPAVNPLPASARGAVTFGCFNNVAKIHRAAVALWTRILHAVPGSRMLLKYTGLEDPGVAERHRQLFREHGLSDDRLEIRGASSPAEHLAAYHDVDLALDTFPYSGGLTTCEALWMGVPVVTCPGETFASRHSLSHLSNAGLTETIATSWDDYVTIATRLATDLPRLARWRTRLRAQLASSPLCNAPQFARDWGQLVRQTWRHWCATPP